MRPYGERKKRRPGGKEHWIYILPRWKQNKKICQDNKYGWDGSISNKKQQRNYARHNWKVE